MQVIECISAGKDKIEGESFREDFEKGAVVMCSECTPSLTDLNIVDRVCYDTGRNMVEKERVPLPISMVRVGKESVVGVATVAAVEAHALYQAAVA